jgi:hypothetical protein
VAGHWRFDTPAATVPDLSGRNHTATLEGGAAIAARNGRNMLVLNGKGGVRVESAPALNLKRGFSIEAIVWPDELSVCRAIVFKDGEYLLRIDGPNEGGGISFFVHDGKGWEPRVRAMVPVPKTRYHIFAVWSGVETTLWVNGLPSSVSRGIANLKPTANPLLIGSTFDTFGSSFAGAIEEVAIYDRALSTSEMLRQTYGIAARPAGTGVTAALFEFRNDLRGWVPGAGATAACVDGAMVVQAPLRHSYVIHDNLNVPVDDKDYINIRMAVDKGSAAELIFATTRGGRRISFPVTADGAMRTYVVEPWQWPAWGGDLIALGLVPASADGATARIEFIAVTPDVRAEPTIEVLRVFTESTLPRASRPETLVARLRNTGGPAADLSVTLAPPPGVTVTGPATQALAALGYQEQAERRWAVQAAGAGACEFRITLSGPGLAETTLTSSQTFQPALSPTKAEYVPIPVPAPSKYTLWTHYCALWKTGTHYGWGKIEPWPERKPVIGWYNEGAPEVADWQIKQCLEHGITGIVYCFYRTVPDAPVTVDNQHLGHALHDGLLKARYLDMINFGIMWENGCALGVSSQDDLMRNVLPFWIENYFSHPQYIRIGGKPVLYVWVPSRLRKDLGGSDGVRQALDAMRAECARRGLGGLYLVACMGGKDAEALKAIADEGWDATSAYGNRWVMPEERTRVGNAVCAPYEVFVRQQEEIWRFKRELNLRPDITAAMAGWDPRPWHEDYFFSENTAAQFRDLCERAKAVMDASPGSGPERTHIIFCCWNEQGEGHYIEPTRGRGYSYLDAIRDVFTDAPREHIDLAPEDVGLGPYDSWYRATLEAGPPKPYSEATSWTGDELRAWKGAGGLTGFEVKDGILTAASASNDPVLGSPPLRVRAGKYSKFVVEMALSKAGTAQLFWTTTPFPRASESASIRVPIDGDDAFHAYTFDVGASEYWGGCLTGLRFDPTGEAGVQIRVRAIRLE